MPSHTDWINDIINDEQYAEEYKVKVQIMPNGTVIPHPDKYKQEFDQVAFDVMSAEDGHMTHVCVKLQCGKPTILNWIKRHPTFRNAINTGRLEGEKKFRKKLMDHAYRPSSEVNNGLIKLLAANIHGIKDESAQIIVNTNSEKTEINAETAILYADAIGRDL